ncbi:MAG TPA: shikimate dehydrogenase [Bradyrhizobium sp.]|uniref:shikimate dehydrogenase family protein n=1 Tax=Bradyrhizobium sp. TaxID=376 RepID=UPI002BC87A0F|nr:shikimate dehydrogenase [Bradyrhizobium sp.]HLZ04905.1 shikimate dehydrogenase [Bradyrhizobium sp.]
MLDHYSGATRVIFILGDPIAQVKAPFGLTGEFARRGRDAIVVPLQLAPANVDAAVTALSRAKNVDGLIATIPHKFAVAARCATLSERSKFLGVVNVARRNADLSWHGDMLDGEGFADPLAKAGCEIKANGALLVGAGGAGSAIALALLDRGVPQLAVHDVDTKRREALIAKLAAKFPNRVVAGSADPSDAGIVVNATPLGMKPGDPLPVDVRRLKPSAFVGDVVTVPDMTPLLVAARQRGCRIQTGIGMFEGNLGLMADFFADAAGCGNSAQ